MVNTGVTASLLARNLPISSLPDYEFVAHVQASIESKRIILGTSQLCRFCGKQGARHFRKDAHTIPEGLGNKWIFSQDECDDCNALFSIYESSLCASVGPILTLGGTRGKRNQVRQSGRSVGSHNIKHRMIDGKRHLSFQMMSAEHSIEPPVGTEIGFGIDGTLVLKMPAPAEKFIPRNAYKALAKIGLALLPLPELYNFKKLIAWVKDIDDREQFSFLDVGLSVGSVGNSPPYVSASVLKRVDDTLRSPYMLMILTVGSACWQLDLMPDRLDDYLDLARFGAINIGWTTTLAAERSEPIRIQYGTVEHFDWSDRSSQPILVETVTTRFNYNTTKTSIDVGWREMRPR